MTSPRLLLFDIDGTLLRTQGAGRAATKAAMEEVFGTAGDIATHDFGGKPDWLTLVELLGDHGHDADSVGAAMPAFEAAMARHMAALIAEKPAHPVPGAMEALTELRTRQDLLPGIVTGNTRASAAVKLRGAGYDPDWFVAGAYGSESIQRNALPPLALERAALYCGCVIDPAATLVIGDTLMDIESARHLGAVAVAVTTGFTDREALAAAGPDHLLDDLRDLVALV